MDFIKSDKFYLPIIYLILGFIIYYFIRIVINKISKREKDKKKITIISLIKNIIKYLILVIVVLSILNVYGINTSGIITSIGVIGVIVGLALQDIITDFLAGLAILFDDKYTIGDVVSINGFKGTVVGFGLMSSKIKAATGEVKILSNSSFKEVINYSHNNTVIFLKLDVAYETNIKKLENALKEMEEEVKKIENVCGDYKILGIEEFSSSSIRYMVSITCKAEKQYQVKRDYYMLVKKYFDKYGIEIPYNKLDVNVRGK